VRTAFLFPGQGSQYPNMLHQLPQHQEVTRTFEEASDALNENVIKLDSKSALASTTAVQVALLTSGVATARTLKAEGVQPDMAAGHSVGAFGAAVIAGALDFKDAVKLVKLRGELMEASYPDGYGMGVVVGIREGPLAEIIHQCSTEEEPVYIANLNKIDQITVSGSVHAIKKVLILAEKKGAQKAELLNVSVPSHCVLLQSVASTLHQELQKIRLSRPIIPYAGNCRGRALYDPQEIRDDLALNVSYPVRWHEATSIFYEMGARLFLEMPPGHVLTNIAAKTFPDARSLSIEESGIKTACTLANRLKQLEL
jgi:malonate decarboxylase epsilon subunit